MEREGSLSLLQKPAICPCPEPDLSNPRPPPPTIFIADTRIGGVVKSDYWFRHVRPSVLSSDHMEELSSHLTDFHEIWDLNIFSENLSKKSNFQISPTRITSTLHAAQYTFLVTFAPFFNEKRFKQKL
jgi:hypothetical protein